MQKKQQKLNNNSIGIFDSGFGGLTVMSAISKLMPKENLIYFGDSAHVPYGSKSKKVVTDFAIQISKFLVKNNVKMVVIACNTASAFSLDSIKKLVNIPVIGVIKSGAMAAIKNTTNKKIGVIGTEGTIKSNAYGKEINKLNKNIKCYLQSCPLFVPLVEEGWLDGEITNKIIRTYLQNIINKNIDTLILGCTHYPLLKKSIQKVIGNKIKIVDSATAVAESVKELLEKNNLLNKNGNGKYQFFVSDSPEKFKILGSKFLGNKINKVTKVEL